MSGSSSGDDSELEPEVEVVAASGEGVPGPPGPTVTPPSSAMASAPAAEALPATPTAEPEALARKQRLVLDKAYRYLLDQGFGVLELASLDLEEVPAMAQQLARELSIPSGGWLDDALYCWLQRTLELILGKVGSLEQLEKEAFRMAAGGEKGCTLASDTDLHHQLRELWKGWLEAQDLGEEGLLDVAPGQPLHLRLLRAMLEAAGDPDRDFLRQAEEGLPVGILDPLPRTPHVFEEQLKWPLENSPWEASLAWVPNYSSVEEHAEFARAKFEEDVREGLMAKMSMGEFLERYGEHTAIAALAVIVEDEELDKKRIIHDATHGVRVNHRVKCRDKLRSPGAREKKHLLREHEEEGETAFAATSTPRRSTATWHARSTRRRRSHNLVGTLRALLR